jgi:hypothetical protein
LFATFAASVLIAESAWARTFPIKHVSRDTLAAACKKTGGNTYSQSGGVYGCAGRGGRAVECTSSVCKGHIPRGVPSQDLTVILSVIAAPAKPSKPDGILGNGILAVRRGLATSAGCAVSPARDHSLNDRRSVRSKSARTVHPIFQGESNAQIHFDLHGCNARTGGGLQSRGCGSR